MVTPMTTPKVLTTPHHYRMAFMVAGGSTDFCDFRRRPEGDGIHIPIYCRRCPRDFTKTGRALIDGKCPGCGWTPGLADAEERSRKADTAKYAVNTTASERFSGEETAQLAALVYKRFGWELEAAAAAWRRMLGNTCDDEQFRKLAEYATDAIRRGLR